MIQILTYLGNEEKLQGVDVKINSFHDAESLDSFEANIISLNDACIWKSAEYNYGTIECIHDFQSLSKMIQNSKKSTIIILLPQNEVYFYNLAYSPGRLAQEYKSSKELKNMIPDLKNILCELYDPMKTIELLYENTMTLLEDKKIPAAFHFNNASTSVITKSIRSDKATTIKCGNIFLSTLYLDDYEKIIIFLRTIGLLTEKQEYPKWMEDVKMFDDDSQLNIIKENNEIIKSANKSISKSMEVIDKNNRYKSILYTTGDELVEVVFEILQEMLGCDLSEFTDKKKEDFKFILGDKVFIGEIKGVTPNVKKANVSQLDVHVQEHLDDSDEESKNIVALLIINHQRTKPLSAREGVNDEVIKLAERNGSLIVETITLLRLFEQYLSSEKDRDECIDTLANTTGLLAL